MPQISTLKILIVDDHDLIRQVMRVMLSALGITDIDTATDGSEAIEVLHHAQKSNTPYDVVFLDWAMPIMTGLEVLTYFRGMPEYQTISFIMLTSESEQQQVIRAIKAGATSYVVKPFDAEVIRLRLLDVQEWMKTRPSPIGPPPKHPA